MVNSNIIYQKFPFKKPLTKPLLPITFPAPTRLPTYLALPITCLVVLLPIVPIVFKTPPTTSLSPSLVNPDLISLPIFLNLLLVSEPKSLEISATFLPKF